MFREKVNPKDEILCAYIAHGLKWAKCWEMVNPNDEILHAYIAHGLNRGQ